MKASIYVLDLESWRWDALKMGFCGQGNLQEYKGNVLGNLGKAYIVFQSNLEIQFMTARDLILAWDPSLPPKASRGRFDVCFDTMGWVLSYSMMVSYGIIFGRKLVDQNLMLWETRVLFWESMMQLR